MTTPGSDLADGIVQSALPEHIARPRDQFMPWHKVRKQFIRVRQWNRLIVRLAYRYLSSELQDEAADWSLDEEERGGPGTPAEVPDSIRIDRPLRCLTIPGDDLLDLRSLWRDLRPLGCFIRYLGFNRAQGSEQPGTRVHVANNEVTSLDRVARDSLVVRDRFQAIESQRSNAYHYLKEYGPFHVVNLDLCDSLFPTKSRSAADYFKALHRLAEYQMKHQTTPWLLFITTQVEPAAVSAPELQKLCQPMRRNCEKHTDFASRLGKLVRPDVFQSQDDAIDISKLTEEDMVPVFGVALGKFLITLAASAHPNWAVQMLRSHRYCIKREPRVEMLSLAFQFRRKFSPPVDSTGLSSVHVTVPKFPSELECAAKLVAAVENISDVDQLLQADDQLRDEMETASADLLEAAGYDRGDYLAWVRSGEGAVQGSMND
jgi:hypothetical protein